MKTLERQLSEYGAFHEREQGTLSIDDATQERTARGVDQSFSRRPWLVVVVAAAAVLILIGGIGLLTRVGTDADTPPVEERFEPDRSLEPPRLTDKIPPELESGTLATPAGDARWVRLNADGASVPNGEALSWPNGFAIFKRADVGRPARLWVSPDGVEWQLAPIPSSDDAESVSLTLMDGEYWLISTNPLGIWRSTDGATWDEYESSGLRPPGPPGLSWTKWFGSPVSGGGLTLLFASYEANLPFQQYLPQLIDGFNLFSDRDESCSNLRKLEPGVFQVVGQAGDQPCPHRVALKFEETGNGLRVLDNVTGTILGEVLGADLSHVERLAEAGDSIFERRIVIIGESGIKVIQAQTPWPTSSFVLKLFGTDEGVYAYVMDPSGDKIGLTVWRTDDGQTWTNLGTPSFLQDGPVTGFPHFWPLDSSLALTIFESSDDGSSSNVGWESSDGITWEPGPVGHPDGTNIVRLGSGWFANDGSQGGPSDGKVWWMHIDGTWVSLADLGMEQPEPGCVIATGIENTTFFSRHACVYRESDAHDVWVLSLEPSD